MYFILFVLSTVFSLYFFYYFHHYRLRSKNCWQFSRFFLNFYKLIRILCFCIVFSSIIDEFLAAVWITSPTILVRFKGDHIDFLSQSLIFTNFSLFIVKLKLFIFFKWNFIIFYYFVVFVISLTFVSSSECNVGLLLFGLIAPFLYVKHFLLYLSLY